MKALPFSFAALLALHLGNAIAQPGNYSREIVTQADVRNPSNEAIIAKVELKPASIVPRHTHHGDEVGYVLSGVGELLTDDEPARKLKPGDAFVIPAGKVHSAHNLSEAPMTVLSVYVVEKTKPLAQPAD